MTRKALGRGLYALIPGEAPTEELLALEISRIDPSPYEIRDTLTDQALAELAASIREKGVVQPVLVRRKDDRFELICGGRRLRAAKQAGLVEIPAVVRRASDSEVLELAIIENVQREDLDPINEASAYRRLMKEFNYTQNDVATKVGKDRSTVANLLRLLELPEKIQSYIRSGKISSGHGRALLAVKNNALRLALAEKIVRSSLTVRDIERLTTKRRTPVTRQRDPDTANLELELSRILGTKVRIQTSRKKGRIEIEFYSRDDFERILEILRGLSSE